MTDDGLTVNVHRQDGLNVVELVGKATGALHALLDATAAPSGNCIINLTAVKWIDSAGIHALRSYCGRIIATGSQVVIALGDHGPAADWPLEWEASGICEICRDVADARAHLEAG